MTRGLSQVLPPLTDVSVATAVSLLPAPRLLVASSPTVYAVPSGPIDTQGSDARLNGVPVNGSRIGLGAQPLNCSDVSPHVLPPSLLKPATSPCAPPSDQRSCCQTPTTLPAVCGLTATEGSTSALTYLMLVLGWPAMEQPAYGLGPDTFTKLIWAAAGDAAVSVATNAMARIVPVLRMQHSPSLMGFRPDESDSAQHNS